MPSKLMAAAAAVMLLQVSGSNPQQTGAQAERGQYLVEEVAKCGMCHTPHNERGEMDRSRWLEGAPVWFVPVHDTSNWAFQAPPLAGLPSLTDAQALLVQTTGRAHDGTRLRPPMHEYHMSRTDAAAIVAYLRSLRPGR